YFDSPPFTHASTLSLHDALPISLDSRAERLRRETDNLTLQNVAPFKVFDNLYYVGVGYVGSWLITTNQGLILIDTLEGAYTEHPDRKSTRLNSSHLGTSYAVFFL